MKRSYKVRRTVGRVAALLVLAVGWCLVPSTLAQDFDFYAMDLIGQESYKKISMDFRDASLKDILKIFSQQAGLNFIAAQSIQDRSVTLYLDAVPLNDALKKIMAANNLTYDLDPGSNIFIVKETGQPDLELVTRIYPLRYARLKSSNLQAQITAGGAADESLEEDSGGGGGGESGGGASAAAEEDKDVGIEATVRNILTDRGRLLVDDRTNSLIVTDVLSQFDVIEQVIRFLDTAIPQVMIEVEILDVGKRTIDEMGMDMDLELDLSSGASRGTYATEPFMHGTLSAQATSSLLDFLRTDTRTKFLARPRILTLSGETAEIKIKRNEVVGEECTVDDNGNAVCKAKRYLTGVSMKVTPQADPESGYVTMFIEPRVVEAQESVFAPGKYMDPEIRSSITTLTIKEGETIVVGGLIRSKKEETLKKMPILGDLPLVGIFFRHKAVTEEDRELLVFLTPRIVRRQDAVSMARSTTAVSLGLSRPFREQVPAVSRKREVDSYLERWEN